MLANRVTARQNGLQDEDLVLLERRVEGGGQVAPPVQALAQQSQAAVLQQRFQELQMHPELLQNVPRGVQNAVVENNYDAFVGALRFASFPRRRLCPLVKTVSSRTLSAEHLCW